jgi:Arc/MetJ family transcription regulator
LRYQVSASADSAQMHAGVWVRINVELDDRLVDKVMRSYRLKTKREAVDLALR